MALSQGTQTCIQVDYEAGIDTLENIAKKYGVARITIIRLAKKFHWERSKCYNDVTFQINEKATKEIIEQSVKKIVDYTNEHLEQLAHLRDLSAFNATALKLEIEKTQNTVSKAEAERLVSIQKFIKLSSETLSAIYRDERLAMGLKNEEETSKINLVINNTQDLSKLSDAELDILIADAEIAE